MPNPTVHEHAKPHAVRWFILGLFLLPFLLPVVAVVGPIAVVLLILGGGAYLAVMFLASIVQAVTGSDPQHIDSPRQGR
jgi:hypothetical protein